MALITEYYYEMVVNISNNCPKTSLSSAINDKTIYFAKIMYLWRIDITVKHWQLIVHVFMALKQFVYNTDHLFMVALIPICHPLILAQLERWQGLQWVDRHAVYLKCANPLLKKNRGT